MVAAIGITLGILFIIGLAIFFGKMYQSAKRDAYNILKSNERDAQKIKRAIDSLKLYGDEESKELVRRLMEIT